MTTLADVITLKTQEEWYAILLGVAQAQGFPTQSWQDGGVEKTRLMAMSAGLESLGNYVPAIGGGSLLDYSPNFPGWTALTAEQIYNIIINPATFTLGVVLATNTATQPYPFTAGSLKVNFAASGRNYYSIGSGTIPASSTLVIPVIAENAGSVYLEPNNSGAITLVTPLPGVTITNPPTSNFTTVTHGGSGTGVVTPTGSPALPHSIVVNISTTGQAGVAAWSYSLDGAAFAAAGAVSSLVNVGGSGITITLSNGALNPSFVLGDTYSFNAPGSWITSQGSDLESDTALATRCRNRWSSLSDIPTQSLYQFLATSTPSVGSQVTSCTVVPDPFINNKVNVVVSGPGGVLPGGTITTIQAYITPRRRGCDNPIVQSPSTLAVTYAFVYTVPVAQASAAASAIITALNTYTASIPVNGTIRIADIIQIVMDIDGVVDCSSVIINGVAGNLVLGGVGLFVLPAYPPTINATSVNI
jgi:hypothetical protein